jgi:Cu2+-exporting ATPase
VSAAGTASLLLEGHWTSESGGEGHAVFNAEGIRCANCARSIDTTLRRTAGVRSADINVANGRVSVTWDTAHTSLPAILRAVADLGFRPLPLAGESAATIRRDERRTSYKRIGLAGLGSMQVMMYAGGLYTGAFDGIDPRIAEFLKLTCLLFATPVLFYSGAPILRGALQDLRNRVLGMDVTVSIALVLAFAASVVHTLTGQGEVYFDSVVMFVFFLLLGRHAEMVSRHQAASVTDALARALPTQVTRLDSAGHAQQVALAAVAVGDRVRVGSGQIVPFDGTLEDDTALLDEALVTGESVTQRHRRGDRLLGGSVNAGATLTVRVSAVAQDSTLHSLVRLLERAQSERPRIGIAAQRMASWFIVRILVLTVLVAIAWAWFDPSRVLPAVLAVLVATCPCALSLATPVAIAASTSRLARAGVLVTRADAVESLAQVDTLVIDKTGTLTEGEARLVGLDLRPGWQAEAVLPVAAALEAESRHPTASAIRAAAATRAGAQGSPLACSDAREAAGNGIEGTVQGVRWRIGRPEWVAGLAARDAAGWRGDGDIALGNGTGIVALFTIADELRADARATIDSLRGLGLDVQLASGDRDTAVRGAARQLGITAARSRLRPEDKLGIVRELQSNGRRVLMVGDGINDGPVLAAADVSAAMGRGSGIAHAASDLLLLRDSLAALPESIRVARRTLVIIGQNLRWAAAYNLAAVPIAALGFMPPWVAALGMSLSSLLVVANARRLAHADGGAR